jgi:hypothetical protein
VCDHRRLDAEVEDHCAEDQDHEAVRREGTGCSARVSWWTRSKPVRRVMSFGFRKSDSGWCFGPSPSPRPWAQLSRRFPRMGHMSKSWEPLDITTIWSDPILAQDA